VILVLDGTLRVWLEDEEYVLEEGDSIAFDSSIPHAIENPGPGTNRHVCAITPPSW
jgi:quercetin dioxygenase-like cupin family protein